MSAALLGLGFGLALGATYLMGGLNQAIAEHVQAVRVAHRAGGTLSETMLWREMGRLDPAALTLARAHDTLADATPDFAPVQAWPGRFGARFPLGRRASAADNARDLDCLTEAVYFEARGETPRGQAAVAQVVMNRLASPSFPKTVCGVVFQGAASHICQFSFACDGSMRRGLEMAAWDRARRIAERALSGVAGGDIGSATHFHTVDVQPAWGPTMLRVAQVGLHIFYRPNPHALAEAGPRVEPTHRAMVEHAVMISRPLAPVGDLKIAAAIVGRATESATPASHLDVAAATKSAPVAGSAANGDAAF